MTTSQPPSNGARRVPLIVVGACLTALALGTLVAGALLLGIHATQGDSDGFYAC